MEREISLSSFSVKDEPGNRPGDFTTRFSRTLNYEHSYGIWFIGFNKIISMAFTWTNINSGYSNQKIAYSKDGGKTLILQILIFQKEFGITLILIITLRKRLKLLMAMVMKNFQSL